MRFARALQDSHLTGHSQPEKGDVLAYLPISLGNVSGPPP
jgi:hypothetical protein